MSYDVIWDKRLANTASPGLLELAPPGTFIYRVINPGFDGNSNFQMLYTHITGNGFDFSQWAADNDGITIDDPSFLNVGDILDNSPKTVYTGLSGDPGQLAKVTNFTGYFIIEVTDGVPSDSSNNFTNTIASTNNLRQGVYAAVGTEQWDNTNLPAIPTVFDPDFISLSLDQQITTATFNTIINDGTSSGGSSGRPTDGMLYPRGFQTQGSFTPDPNPDPEPELGDNELPAGARFQLIQSTQSANLNAGDAQTFVVAEKRYLNWDMRPVPGGATPIEPPSTTPTNYYLYYIDNASQRQVIVLPNATGNRGSSNTWRQMGWVIPSPDTTNLTSILGYDTTFVISDTLIT